LGAALVISLCLLYAVAGPGPVDSQAADEVIGRTAVEHMRTGESYYEAMDQALRATNGPPKSWRAFREPMIFELWSLLSNERAVWLAFVVLAGLAGLAVAATSDAPLVAPLIPFYLLKSARLDQQFLVEMWAGPALVIAIASWRRGWYRTAAVITTATVLIRELAVVLLVGGLLSRRRDRTPWLVGLVVAVVCVGAHFAFAGRYASSSGSEAPLLGTGGLERALDMAGVGFSDRAIAGLVLWPVAWLRIRTDRELALFAGPLLAVPVLGLFVGRDYWGFVVVPTILLFALEGIWSVITRVRGSMSRQRRESNR
jgi:hypothetical protein